MYYKIEHANTKSQCLFLGLLVILKMNKHIIIIGAGASGLAAASRLVKMGINSQNLTVLEAQARIGGRIHTIIEGAIKKLATKI